MNLFDKFSSDYDKMVNWKARLAREGEFFREVFAEKRVRTILDLGCGTGKHAMMLASWGLEVTGVDASAAMIEQARENAAQAGLHINFLTAGFTDFTEKVDRKFDAVILIGNSLPHLLNITELETCINDIYRVLNSPGLLIIQNRNYDKVLQKKERFMPLNAWEGEGEEVLFLRFMDFQEDQLLFNIITLTKRAGKWDYQVLTNPLRPILSEEMQTILAKTGWQAQTFYGDYQQTPFIPEKSGDLIVLADKA